MPTLTKEKIVAEKYDPSESQKENALRISKETGIKLTTCYCYLTSVRKGVSRSEYVKGQKELRKLETIEPSEAIEMLDNQNGHKQRLSELEKKEMRERIKQAIDSLPEEGREIIISYFYEGRSQFIIGQRMNKSHQVISQRMQKALRTIHAYAIENGLGDYAS